MRKQRLTLTILFLFCLFPSFLAADNTIYEDKFLETQGNGLSIRSNPSGVSVFIDGVERGITPFIFTNLTPGEHRIRLSKEEYKDRYFDITLFNNSRLDISILMIEERGIARVSINRDADSSGLMPLDPELTVISKNEPQTTFPLSSFNTATLNLRSGMRTIRVRAFGWEEEIVTVMISERNPATVNIVMKPAAFSMGNISQSRKRLNPKNSGNLGATEYRFEVSTFGNGNLTIFDSDRRKVYEKNLGRFDTWVQSVKWNGRDSSGNPLPEGNYIAVIEASPRPEFYTNPPEAIAMTLETTINYSLNVFPLSLSGGISGLVFAPLPHTLPARSFQIEGNLLFGNFHTQENNTNEQYEDTFSSLPFDIGFRIAPVNRLELTAVFNVHPRFDGSAGWGVTGSVKFNILSGGVPSLAAGVSYAWASENGETPLSPGRGIGLYMPLSLELEKFSFVFSPAVFWYGPDSPVPELLLSAGFLYRKSWMNAGPSFRAEIDFNADSVADNTRFLFGADARFFLPPSNFVFSFQVGMWSQNGHLGEYGGVGIGVIF